MLSTGARQLRVEGLVFADAASLTEVALARVDEGLMRRVRRDDSEPALAFLDRLSLQRSDWHPAIAQALATVATSGAGGATAAADFFATATSGPIHAQVLGELCDGGWQARTSELLWHRAGSGIVDQDALRAAILPHPACWAIVFDKRPFKYFNGLTAAGRRAAVANAVEVGRPRTDSQTDCCVLGFLRTRALFVPGFRDELVGLLQGLWADGDPRGWFCVMEYVAVAQDPGWLRAFLGTGEHPVGVDGGDDEARWRQRARLRFHVDEPAGWPRNKGRTWVGLPMALGEQPSFAEVFAHALARLNELDASAPMPEAG